MSISTSQLFRNFDLTVDRVRKLSKQVCEQLSITVFGYVRIHDNGTISWLTTSPDQDRFLVESDELCRNPLVNGRSLLKQGVYLDLYNQKFPGCEEFYRERAKRFKMDHGMVLVRHQEDYIETCCFSGLTDKRPLYQLFMNEQGLFKSFMNYFTLQLDPWLEEVLSEGIMMSDLKDPSNLPAEDGLYSFGDRVQLLESCGEQKLLILSRREQQCLVLLREGHTYHSIGKTLGLSERTIEHYLESVKNKLNVETRADLFLIAEKLVQLHVCKLGAC